jgi:hypothetical protein|tara:strand:+ start:632 stop:1486 length:855 start_codon:yes stop_codon:yes gene_type:complete
MKLQISIEELRKHKIFIGTPMYGGNCSGSYTKSCTDLAMMCAANGIDVRFYYLFNESLIQRARNYVVDEFMRSDCTHLIFIDSDIAFDPRDVLGLIAIQVSDPKFNVVTGPYPKKTIAWEKVKKAVEIGKAEDTPFALDQYTADYVFNPINKLASFNLSEPLEIGEGGTGFMCIPRETFEKYKEAYPEYSYKPDHIRTENFDGSNEIMAYFDCIIDPKTKRYLSEDYFFCHKARAAGMQVWMCPWMQINHIGSYIFKGNMAAIGSLGVSATADKSASKKTYKKD